MSASATAETMSRRSFMLWLLAILAVAAVLRGLFPAADPPTHASVGIVWHDEGAWVHNARNKALFGAWSLDAWNPMFIAPVFTGLEYLAFEAFGVGVRQARLVSEVLGWLSVALLGLGIARIGGRRAGLIAAAFLATNYVYVMWNRAALMEASMTAFIVASWYCYVRAEEAARWAWGAALFAVLAFFTKAAAVFFVAAIGLDAIAALGLRRRYTPRETRFTIPVLAGLTVCGLAALVVFILPNWTEYRFYNWQMSVTRKPSYDIKSLMDRVTWFPVLHDFFTRMWFSLVVAVAALAGILARWRTSTAAERLLVWWVVLGALELLVHDVGNERRFVFFIPALAGLAAMALGRARPLLPSAAAAVPRRLILLALPVIAYAAYVVIGGIVRVLFLYEIRPNVRLSAALAVFATALLYATWPRLPRWLSSASVPPRAAVLLTALVVAGDLAQYVQWALARTYVNYEASLLIGRTLPAGTLVHGKLANGLALENRIRPIFVGHGFGNFDDRTTRDDVRYILTYITPRVGYEGSQITEVLDAYPNRTIIMTFDVAETATGQDRAALIDKFGGAPARKGQPGSRAQD